MGNNVEQIMGELYPEVMLADGFDEALIGVCHSYGRPEVAAYSLPLLIDILVTRDGMSIEDAEEFFEYNIVGAFVGDHTPVFITPVGNDNG